MTKPYSEDLSHARGGRCQCGSELPRGGTAVQYRSEQRCTVGAAVSADRARRCQADGRRSQLASQRRARLAARLRRRGARFAASRHKARACRAPYPRRLWHDLALLRQGEDHL